MVWVDLEMSGLDPERDRILEVAVLLTDGELEVQVEGPELVLHQPEEVLATMDAWNREHHAASGLLDRVRASELDERAAEQEVLDFLGRWLEPEQAPLAGNSVHQDRAFLARWMPGVHRFLHYRHVDVSTLKELVERWYPEVASARPPKARSHRAMQDIHESIRELRFYRERVFRPRA